MSKIIFPELKNWEPTRQTLHWYSRGVTAIPRAHAKPHPKWWHVSLEVDAVGLVTDKSPLPDDRALWLKMDLSQHKAILFVDDELFRDFDLKSGLTATEFAELIIAAAAELGLKGKYSRDKFENNEARLYDPKVAEVFFAALVEADRLFKGHRSTLSGERSPVQLWPHNFDLAFEWFGTRVEIYEDVEYPSQLNLGFYPGDPNNKPYFYSNPWPFEGDILLDNPLPEGARWHTEGWQGTILPYSELAGDSNASQRLLGYAKWVYELCSPTLMADRA